MLHLYEYIAFFGRQGEILRQMVLQIIEKLIGCDSRQVQQRAERTFLKAQLSDALEEMEESQTAAQNSTHKLFLSPQ